MRTPTDTRTRRRSTNFSAQPQQKAEAPFARAVRLPDTAPETALARAKTAVGLEGFGVLAEIDLRDTLRRKLDKDIGPFWIVEICNPHLADRALAIDRRAGLLVPCKVAVWQEGTDAVVAALRPEAAVSVMGGAELEAIAQEAERHVEQALVRLEASPA